MIFEIANERVLQQEDDYEIIPRYCNDKNDGEEEETVGLHHFVGKYTINIHPLIMMEKVARQLSSGGSYKYGKKISARHHLHPDLLRVICSA